MMKSVIKKVSVKHGEAFKGRVLEVKCKKDKSFKTPSKIPSTTEILGKKHLKSNMSGIIRFMKSHRGITLPKSTILIKTPKILKSN